MGRQSPVSGLLPSVSCLLPKLCTFVHKSGSLLHTFDGGIGPIFPDLLGMGAESPLVYLLLFL